jgi:ABC-type multidrug transport system ATPase subunit
MTPAIHLTNIVKRFGPVTANAGADLEVQAGEIHALVGENGAGKSTLMRVLSGMYAPNAGTMEVNGRDVTGWSTSEAIAAAVLHPVTSRPSTTMRPPSAEYMPLSTRMSVDFPAPFSPTSA